MKASLLLLVAVWAVTCFSGLGHAAMTDAEETFYAEAGREMIESGDWITPHLNYSPRFEKPILSYWAIAVAYLVAGVGEASARFFSSLSALGLVLIAFVVGRRWGDTTTGFIAGLIVATSFGTFWMARQSLPDLPLAFFITLATWTGIEALTHGRKWLFWCAGALALAMLTKGPSGVAIPVGIVLLNAIGHRLLRLETPAGARPIHIADMLGAMGIFLLIAAPWYIAETLAYPDYLKRFFYTENIERALTTKFNDHRGLTFYVWILLGGFLPWSAFALLWMKSIGRAIRGRLVPAAQDIALIAWAAVPFLLFSAVVGKQPRYILPCLVPLALLLARSIAARVRSDAPPVAGRGYDWPLAIAAGLAGLSIAIVGALVIKGAPLFALAQPGWTTTRAIATVAAGVIVAIVALTGYRRHLIGVIGVAAIVMLSMVQYSVTALGRPEPVEVIARAMLAEPAGATLCACGAFGRNLGFYTGRQIVGGAEPQEIAEILNASTPVLAVVDAERLLKVEAILQRRLPQLASAWYLETDSIKPKSFLEPDPVRDLQRVILVKNR